MASTLTFYKRLCAATTTIPLFLHIFGLTMICKTSKTTTGSSGKKRSFTTTSYTLIGLSLFEIIHLMIIVTTSILPWKSKWWWYVVSYECATSVPQMLFILIFMTSERFFRIYLGIKYSLYWNAKSTIRLIMVSFVVLLLITLPFVILYSTKILYHCFVYVYPFGETLFIIHFIASYIYIFRKVKKSRLASNYGASVRNVSSSRKNDCPVKNKNNKCQIVGSLNYKIPFLIVLNFCLVYILPNIYITYLLVDNEDQLEEDYFKFLTYFHQTYLCVDALIYIWLTPRIKKRVIALFSCRRKQSEFNIRNEKQLATVSSSVAKI